MGFSSSRPPSAAEYPILNSSVNGNDIMYHGYFDIGISSAGSPRGLVVPNLRNADQMSTATSRRRSAQQKAKDGKLTLEA
ncbi:2-oxo acid dehydrogenase subunit E2 [Massilia phosphatilytica]